MIVWCDDDRDPVEQMRRDVALLDGAVRHGPRLRLYRFRPHGITLGHAQDPARELDLDRCRRDGVPWAVRPTGGRAIFHAEEWTYALAAPLDDPEWGGSRRASHDRISEWIRRSLERLGVPAETAAGHGADGPPRGRDGAAPPCFASTARSEITVAGAKLVGSAQRRTAHALLQQGSVLLGPGHLRLADYLRLDDAARDATRGALAAAATDAGRWIDPETPLARWAEALMAERGDAAGVRSAAPEAFRLTPRVDGSYTPAVSPD
jgi:lipoate-protein ligase A